MGSPHPKDLQISFGGFTQLVELDLGPIPGSRICELVNWSCFTLANLAYRKARSEDRVNDPRLPVRSGP